MSDLPAAEDVDVLIALQYDTCEAAEKCQPCKGVRQKAIAEITELRASIASYENARKIAVSEIGRLRARIMELETPSKLPIEFRE